MSTYNEHVRNHSEPDDDCMMCSLRHSFQDLLADKNKEVVSLVTQLYSLSQASTPPSDVYTMFNSVYGTPDEKVEKVSAITQFAAQNDGETITATVTVTVNMHTEVAALGLAALLVEMAEETNVHDGIDDAERHANGGTL